MNFLAPLLLIGLLLLPLLLGAYVWAQRRRTRYAVRFTNLDLLANLAPRRPAWRRHVPPALYLAAVAALVLGLARPTMLVATPREDATVLLTIDVSGSMKATDVSPTRLDAARAAALSFIGQLPEGIRVGVVAFASRPQTLVEPTADHADAAAAIERLTAQDGTAMGDALMTVLDIAEDIQNADDGAASTDPTATPAPDASAAPDPSAAPDASTAPDAPIDAPSDEPLVAAMCIGRIGCFLTGPLDQTAGDPTSLPWGIAIADGIPRHPVALYEIAFLLAFLPLTRYVRRRSIHEGDFFRVFLASYFF